MTLSEQVFTPPRRGEILPVLATARLVLRAPRRGDVVVFANSSGGGVLNVKRVIAVEGDTVETDGPVCNLNGAPLTEPYLNAVPVDGLLSQGEFRKFGPLRVPAGKVFVLGDNRHRSWDSRHYGPIDIGTIKGRPIYIYWSTEYSRIGKSVE